MVILIPSCPQCGGTLNIISGTVNQNYGKAEADCPGCGYAGTVATMAATDGKSGEKE